MICISGLGRVPDASPFPGSTIFLADECQTADLTGADLGERIEAALAGELALVWAPVGPRADLLVIAHDSDGRTLRPVTLPGGRTIPAGSILERTPTEVVIRDGQGTNIRLDLAGADTGVLRYEAEGPLDAWIRYFHHVAPPNRGGTGPELGGYRFRIFESESTAVRTTVRFDPTRPCDPTRSRLTPSTAEARRTFFRTPAGGAISLAARPPFSNYVYAFDPAREEAYLTLDGFWDWEVDLHAAGDEAAIDLMPGCSGAEYARAPASWGVRFVAGAPAFADRFRPKAPAEARGAPGAFPLVSRIPGVEEDVTTAWIYVAPAPEPTAPAAGTAATPDHAGYYSQPARAALFTPEPGGPFLEALPLEAAPLPYPASSPYAPNASFPAAPFAGIEAPASRQQPGNRRSEGDWLDGLRRFEAEVLGAARTQAIYALEPNAAGRAIPPRDGPSGGNDSAATAVTPQGLLSVFSPDFAQWEQLILAQTTGSGLPLRYANIRGKLREALLANQLFLVVSDVEKLYAYCSTTYCVTDDVLRLAQKEGAPKEVLEGAGRLRGKVFPDRDEFLVALQSMIGGFFEKWKDFFSRYAEYARLSIAGWTFDLASRHWAAGDDSTILIIKFAEDDFKSLVEDRSRWTLPDVFNEGNGAAVQERLLRIIAEAQERVESEPDLEYFVNTVLANAGSAGGRDVWNGVLYLNAAVPANAFPPEIAALAAGLPPGPLRAHHLGITLSTFCVTNGRVELADSSLFGLILYDDTQDLIYRGDPYDYKVLSLRVRFANSTIASFSSQIELLVAKLFNEFAVLEDSRRGNNIVLEGTLQKGSYRFATSERSRFSMESHVLDRVTITGAQFVTLVDQNAPNRMEGRFLFNGSLAFRRLDEFDLFGFGPGDGPNANGGLAFSNLFIALKFESTDPSTRTFDFVAGQMTFDLANSRARPDSLPRRFPLQVVGMRQGERSHEGDAAMPPDLGFIPIESPLVAGSLGDDWYGLEMAMDFGSPGGLAPKLGFSGALLAAWAPDTDRYNVAVGLRLPGSEDGKKSLTIMGPLKLSMRRLNLLFDPDTRGYLLRFQDVALSFLGLSFPPGGRTNALIFGDPDPKASNNSIGWYLAYKKDEEKKSEAMGRFAYIPTEYDNGV